MIEQMKIVFIEKFSIVLVYFTMLAVFQCNFVLVHAVLF